MVLKAEDSWWILGKSWVCSASGKNSTGRQNVRATKAPSSCVKPWNHPLPLFGKSRKSLRNTQHNWEGERWLGRWVLPWVDTSSFHSAHTLQVFDGPMQYRKTHPQKRYGVSVTLPNLFLFLDESTAFHTTGKQHPNKKKIKERNAEPRAKFFSAGSLTLQPW